MKVIKKTELNKIAPLFVGNRYDTVLIGSVLSAHTGSAIADDDEPPRVARLDSGAFTMLGGDPNAQSARDLLNYAPIHYVTPENNGWKNRLIDVFGDAITYLPFTAYELKSPDPARLEQIVAALPDGFVIRRLTDPALCSELPEALNNHYFFESFNSIDDFLLRGVGFCALYQSRIVCAATSTAATETAIDIEIETARAFRGRGLAAAVGAQLIMHCIENRIQPKWLAANPESERLAQKLGFTVEERYCTMRIGVGE